ncbi:hypothetical protein AG1IA_05640 [Rhizoctonia solani AG-1 IA]|uniref:Uncharacterized protein n=1 Tax=Thanatephorus cucumeris (strain AG1-IA) TaxID=983506 RepID=L8WU66_THACA|nr:hypothetical protein AG1IA_05640 [Rhizoctonia solani AG-1 IA]
MRLTDPIGGTLPSLIKHRWLESTSWIITVRGRWTIATNVRAGWSFSVSSSAILIAPSIHPALCELRFTSSQVADNNKTYPAPGPVVTLLTRTITTPLVVARHVMVLGVFFKGCSATCASEPQRTFSKS